MPTPPDILFAQFAIDYGLLSDAEVKNAPSNLRHRSRRTRGYGA